ncbi:hypothetical protein DXG01_015333, partial [Tephrocybe rancida]
MDSMHALDLGLFANHLRQLFQIDAVNVPVGGDGMSEAPPPVAKTLPINDRKVKKCLDIILANPPDLIDQLTSFHRKVLYTVCCKNNILGLHNTVVVGTRRVLATNISNWVQRPEIDPDTSLTYPADDDESQLGDQDEVEEAPDEDELDEEPLPG